MLVFEGLMDLEFFFLMVVIGFVGNVYKKLNFI